MHYRLRDKSVERRSYRMRIAVLAILVCALVGALWLAPDPVSRFARIAALPLWKGGTAAAGEAGVGANLLKSKRSLIDENARLRDELEQAKNDLLGSQGLQVENEELRALLSIPQGRDFVFAAVLAKPPVSPYDSIVIDAGQSDGVRAGDLVYAGENIVLGEISDVQEGASVARLYSTPQTDVEVTIERTSVAHHATGDGAGNFELKAPKEVDIAVGDILLLPGSYKKVIGIVRKIESGQTESFQKVYARTPVNIFQLKWVGIERPPR